MTFIHPGAAVILDSGSTTHEIARIMQSMTDVTVMTNGLNVAEKLSEAAGIELMMTGESLRHSSFSFYGAQAEQSLQYYRFDVLFLGVDGISLSYGITTHHEPEARLNRIMCEVLQQKIAVTDSSKFKKSGLHRIVNVDAIDILITDDRIPENIHQSLIELGVKVELVKA